MPLFRIRMRHGPAFWHLALVLLAVGGCSTAEPKEVRVVTSKPTVRLVNPVKRDLTRDVGQPGFVDAFEQTAIYAKLAGYLEKWNVDIGDKVKAGQVVATLSIPELIAEHEQKVAQVEQEVALVAQAKKLVEVADSTVKASVAMTDEAKANVGKYQADVDRWESEVKRLSELSKEDVVNRQVLAESRSQLKSNLAAREAAKASVAAATANQLTSQASLDKARVDVTVAQARVKVAQAEEKRLAALVAYTQLTAPYDGVITLRNANKGDFIVPAAGDPSASTRSADQSTSRAAPVFVVARTDKVRVYVDIPGYDADYVKEGGKATVRLPDLSDTEIPATVTRTSWALNVKSRTLRAEIDIPNTDARIRPGVYSYGKVIIERKGVLAVPAASITEIGNRTACYLEQDGKAVLTTVQPGISDGTWIELVRIRHRRPGQAEAATEWQSPTGQEKVILGDLSELSDGQEVIVAGKEG